MMRLQHHLFGYAGLSGAAVKLRLCTTLLSRAWSDAPRRSWEIAKLSWLFRSKHCRYLSVLYLLGTSSTAQTSAIQRRPYVVTLSQPTPAERKGRKKPAATSLNGALQSTQIAQRAVQHKEGWPNTRTVLACFTLSVSCLSLLSHFVGKNPILRIRAVLCCLQPSQIWLFFFPLTHFFSA